MNKLRVLVPIPSSNMEDEDEISVGGDCRNCGEITFPKVPTAACECHIKGWFFKQ